ncbi:hypothetical protein COV25_03535 [candidate division WWE3 bacterium CG10_big_fil_rev_8_21_14_0_10_35_32]|nr:MAG: hypothetical protein COV25_03535 [candidate division WWE3 bacterium CG10_big_fil_rev_8_21_14_0_10_35_32]
MDFDRIVAIMNTGEIEKQDRDEVLNPTETDIDDQPSDNTDRWEMWARSQQLIEAFKYPDTEIRWTKDGKEVSIPGDPGYDDLPSAYPKKSKSFLGKLRNLFP